MSYFRTHWVTTPSVTQLRRLVNNWQERDAPIAPGYEQSWMASDYGNSSLHLVTVQFASYDALAGKGIPEVHRLTNSLSVLAKQSVANRNFDDVLHSEAKPGAAASGRDEAVFRALWFRTSYPSQVEEMVAKWLSSSATVPGFDGAWLVRDHDRPEDYELATQFSSRKAMTERGKNCIAEIANDLSDLLSGDVSTNDLQLVLHHP
jgi:hypothetical protein